VGNVAEFGAGQTIAIDSGTNLETALVATVGAAGDTAGAADPGATVFRRWHCWFCGRADDHCR
jgi:hypothetical protein